MNALLSLWLPILLSAVVVFAISSLIHMVIKWHAPDYRGFKNEDAVRDAIRAGNPVPGQYVVPYCKEMKEFGTEAMMQKFKEGPVGFVVLTKSGSPGMGRTFAVWFLMGVVVAAIGAFIATQIFGLDPTRARAAAKMVGAVTFLSYGMGTICESVWMGRAWSSSAKYMLDAALYGAGTAAVFYWMWPE